MIAQSMTFPAAPKPPDDPLHLLLDARAGWRMSDLSTHIDESLAHCSLGFSPQAGTSPSLLDVAGTFGGLELPTGVAIDAAGDIFLLDAASGKLKRFDPCECRFQDVPCIGGIGTEPRQFKNPHGIAFCGGDLLICDTDNARVQVLALRGMTLRAVWMSPAAAALSQAWQPFDLTFDARGRAFVSDLANGVIHRFDRRGNWQLKFGALNQPTHLAIGNDDQIYVIESGTGDVAVFDLDGTRNAKPLDKNRPDKLARSFSPTGIATDSNGNLYLAPKCVTRRIPCTVPNDPSTIAFDLHGNPFVLSPSQQKAFQSPRPTFEQEGVYLSDPLDSEIYRCQWHSVAIHGALPDGAQIIVDTFTAETPLDSPDLSALPSTAWQTHQSVSAMADHEWDCLVTSPPGRFLYLRLTLRGNGAVTPRINRIKIFSPRISLRRYLPAVFGENPVSADFTDRMLAVFDAIFRSVETRIDYFARYLDPMSAPAERDPRTLADFLTWLASWMGVVLDRSWDEGKRRLFLRDAHIFHQLRGTLEGLRRQLLLYLGWTSKEKSRPYCTCRREPPLLILEHFKLRRWLFLGAARLGEQSVLWGKRIVNRTQLNETARAGATQLIGTPDPVRDPFHFYAHKFSVFVPAACVQSDDRRAAIERLIRLAKPAHTAHQLELVYPRFRIGFQSAIGLDSVVGQYPLSFTLGQQRLGSDTALGEANSGPHFQIGMQSRIGTTAILD